MSTIQIIRTDTLKTVGAYRLEEVGNGVSKDLPPAVRIDDSATIIHDQMNRIDQGVEEEGTASGELYLRAMTLRAGF